MANFTFSNLDELIMDMDELAELPNNVVDDMLLAEAAVVEDAQKKKAESYGVRRTGMMINSIGHGKIKTDKDGNRVVHILPKGKNLAGIRNAEVAFVNEYGKHGQPARPFIRDANESAADEAVSAAEDIYDEYLHSKNLL